ncbi:MAG TPA: metal-dependent hydrolase [Acidimicrobiales bacterium]|nr:metal-dependent hydrolase [Acidimicrobiales bacterium]
MSDLQVRRIPFTFDDVDFHWNPSNKAISVFVNAISFWVIGLEKYFVRTMREAESRITDPDVLEEAQLFRQQEAVHAATHRRHVNALIDQYPGLQAVLDDIVARYDALFEAHALEYHLAYAAGLEGTFTPTFKMIMDHRHTLLADGDARVASLTLWHFCEEVEHRSSAVIVYDHVVGDAAYKIRAFPSVVRHLDGCMEALQRGFQAAVPGEAGAAHYGGRFQRLVWRGPANPLADVPVSGLVTALVRSLRSLTSTYDHQAQPLPAYAEEWFARFDAGEDMTEVFGVPHGRLAS